MKELTSLLSFNTFTSGETLSASLRITRAAVWKRIQSLRATGIDIQSAGKKGYRLVHNAKSVNPLYWEKELKTEWLGQNIIYEEQMNSTNSVLKEAANKGAPHGTIALCEHQLEGRGRLNRVWETVQAGSQLTCSVLIRPQTEIDKAPLFTLITGLSLAQSMESLGANPGIKWPNDIILSGKKVAGILLEMTADMDGLSYVVIGTGINVFKGSYPTSLDGQATSIEEYLCGPTVSCQDVLLRYLEHLEENLKRFENEGFVLLKNEYQKRCITLNSRVRVIGTETYEGEAKSIDNTGALIVVDDDNILRRVLYGDVSVRGVIGYV